MRRHAIHKQNMGLYVENENSDSKGVQCYSFRR
ncbi:protein of unknown function [Magnetospirillum sp. XM-1]|nr:protein of unknown function [Magnetospirillum sp. XM-1]